MRLRRESRRIAVIAAALCTGLLLGGCSAQVEPSDDRASAAEPHAGVAPTGSERQSERPDLSSSTGAVQLRSVTAAEVVPLADGAPETEQVQVSEADSPSGSSRSDEDGSAEAEAEAGAMAGDGLVAGRHAPDAVAALTDGAAEPAPQTVAQDAQTTLSQVLEDVIPVEQPARKTDAGPRIEAAPEVDLPDTVTGPYASELNSSHLELFSLGWSRTGNVTLSDVEVYEMGDGVLALQACVDSSGVQIRDAAGDVVPQPSPRSMQIFLLEPKKEGYAVAAQTFPKDPSC